MSRAASPPGSGNTLATIAYWSLVAHAVSNIISVVAFGTFLVEPYPAWLSQPQYLSTLQFGLTWGGQLTVLIGAIAGFTWLATRIGVRTTTVAFAVIFVLTLGAELSGTHFGFPFGQYAYSDRLGYKILDLVPFNIPTSWFYMLVGCLAICARLLPAKNDELSKWWWSLCGGLALTAWDVLLDPAMVKTYHWIWNVPDLSGESAFIRFIGEPIFFGMPITNWLGWLLTGILVSRAMLAIIPPTQWARDVAPYRFPLVLYGLNGLLPLAICLRQDMLPAAALGSLVMFAPLVAAWRAGAAGDAKASSSTLDRVATVGQ